MSERLSEQASYLRDGSGDLRALLRHHPRRGRSVALLGRGSRCRGAHDPCLRPGRRGAAHRVRRQPGRQRHARRSRPGRRSSATAEMVAHGITRARLPAQNEVICTLNDPRTAGAGGKARHDAFGGGARTLARSARRRAWSPSAMRRPLCSGCSRCSMPARRNPPRSSAFRSASSARPNPRRRWPTIRAACRF